MKQRGSILVEVLILGMLLLVLVATLIKAVTQYHQFGAMTLGGTQALKGDQSVVNTVQSAWTSQNGQTCTSYSWPSGDVVCCDNNCGLSMANTCSCSSSLYGAGTCSVKVGGQYYSVSVSGTPPNCMINASQSNQ